MIKRLLLISLVLGVLSGCSLVDNVNNSLDYTQEATTFMNEAAQFAESIPELAQQAATNADAQETLTKELEAMKTRISEFNGIEAPAFAKTIHEQLVALNDTLLTDINGYMDQIQNGVTDFQNSNIAQTINKINETMDKLQNLQP
ncbi:hypothetical protein PVOR_04948 [Paenibacillus vortex V453]|uniref:Lipoprotein n=2 Tax=Paenibacillus TaxID=44249 RepID=A0A163JLY0_9BACL|nr:MULTISPECIES: DUF6376 family protein [Paenibacillus]EFU43082.1 hypothetical protein PVOR_04948 [Paenibacillus vortex V453]KZS46666.1 hypothetical protein AWU65_12420 [Paenibacillus glucanolyticus]